MFKIIDMTSCQQWSKHVKKTNTTPNPHTVMCGPGSPEDGRRPKRPGALPPKALQCQPPLEFPQQETAASPTVTHPLQGAPCPMFNWLGCIKASPVGPTQQSSERSFHLLISLEDGQSFLLILPWAELLSSQILLPSPFHGCWSQEQSLNFLHDNLHLRAHFLGKPPVTITNPLA